MTEMTAFEARLAGMFQEYAAHAPVEIDSADVVAVIRAADRPSAFHLGRRRWLLSVLLAALLIVALGASVLIGAMLLIHKLPPVKPLIIQPTGFMTQQRAGASSVALADGRVLVLGGSNSYAGANQSFGEIYEPATRTFTSIGNAPSTGIVGGAATALADGRVLYSGGMDRLRAAVASATLFDPASDAFVPLPDMVAARAGHSATLLPDGRVVLIGGGQNSADAPVAIEYFDPATLTFTAGSDPQQLRTTSTVAVPISSHEVFVYVRGRPPGPSNGTDPSGFVLDTNTGQVSQVALSPPGVTPDAMVSGASALPDGRIAVIVGGPSTARVADDLLVVFDPKTRAYSDPVDLGGIVVVGPTTLADGRVLVGQHSPDGCGDVFAAVLDPTDMSLKRVGQIGGIGGCIPGSGPTVTALDDGSALIAGGYMSSGQESSSASLVHP